MYRCKRFYNILAGKVEKPEPQLTAMRTFDPDLITEEPKDHEIGPPLELKVATTTIKEEDDNLKTIYSETELTPAVSFKVKREKCKIIKNLIVLSLAFLLNFTAFQNLSNLQSSLNRVDGLGTVGLSVIYASLIISCVFFPSVIIKQFGCKWAIALSLLPYSLYVGANIYPMWGSIIPTALLVGVCAAPLWASKCTYLTYSARRYAILNAEEEDIVITKFFGFFWFCFQSAQIWGNLISSFILQTIPENGTVVIPEEELAKCGVFGCSDIQIHTNNTNLQRPDPVKVYILCGTFVGLGVLAMLTVSFLLDPLQKFIPGYDHHHVNEQNCCHLLIATVKHLRHKNQLLLIPLNIYSGLEQAFLASDFTKNYVSCTLGVWMVGLILVCFGVADALGSLLFSRIIKYTGRIPVFILGAIIHCVLQLSLFLWRPSPDRIPVFFVIAAAWGLGDAVWQTQINSLHGVIFPSSTEAAFSNYRLWESTGFIIAFAYSSFLCVYVKLYILISMLIIGMIGYFIVEYRLQRKLNSQKS